MVAEAYCVKCKTKRTMKGEKKIVIKSKGGKTRAAITGDCGSCGVKVFRITGMKK